MMAKTVGNVVAGMDILATNCLSIGIDLTYWQLMDKSNYVLEELGDLAKLEDSALFERRGTWLELMPQIYNLAQAASNMVTAVLKRAIAENSRATPVPEIDAIDMQSAELVDHVARDANAVAGMLEMIPELPEYDALRNESSTWQDDVSMEWPADILPKWPDDSDILTDRKQSEATENNEVERMSSERRLQFCLQVNSDARIAFHDAQALMCACNAENVRNGSDYIRESVFRIPGKRALSRNAAYSVFSVCVQKIMATMTGIKESWHWIKPTRSRASYDVKLRLARSDPDDTYAQLMSEAYEILRELAAGMRRTMSSERPSLDIAQQNCDMVLIARVREFAANVVNVSDRARTRSHAYKGNIGRDRRVTVRNERPNTKPHKRKRALWAPGSDSD
jgi:hypothetical protein